MENNNVLWVKRVRRALTRLSKMDEAPALDIKWLMLRCDDTLRYPEDIQRASALELVKDLAAFDEIFPGHMSDLLRGPDPE